MSESKGAKTRLSSVSTAIHLLKAFSEKDAEIGISALSKRLSVSKSTVHRLATTLVAEGLLEQNPETERYRLGIALFTLGALVRRRLDISNEAKPLLSELRRVTNENVHLAILQGSHVTYIYDLESSHPVRLGSQLGTLKPAFCSAEGLAILAYQPDAVIDTILAGDLSPRTNNTITDIERIRQQLKVIRQQGHAIENEESEIGTRGAAAPVHDAEGSVIAAVGLAGPSQRLSRKALTGYIPHVIGTADTISMRLGYRPPARAFG
jgi:IclR family transcriptional regulator, KDG regulon repressor